MKVSELIEQLKRHDGDAEVMFTYNYGDYWKTEVAQNVSSVSIIDVEYSDYHRMDKVVEINPRMCDEDGEEIENATREVVGIG